MKRVIPDSERTEELLRWRGGIAKVWLYHISLRRLAIRIHRPSMSSVLYIVGNGCEYICGPFGWSDAELVIDDELDRTSGDNVCHVKDAAARFELRCSAASLAVGPASELDESFANFLGDGA